MEVALKDHVSDALSKLCKVMLSSSFTRNFHSGVPQIVLLGATLCNININYILSTEK